MSALAHFKKEVRKELPKADEWLITYSAKVRLRSWIESHFKKSAELKSALKHFMNEEDQRAEFTEDEDSLFPTDEGGYLSPYQEMVEADTAAFYEAVKTTAGAVVDRVQEAIMVVCFG
uniref:Uncharacterized protein n=1 Tax=viral metagenome TaxID=1070528 RepID=A0A6C0LAR6_9ZZZZ